MVKTRSKNRKVFLIEKLQSSIKEYVLPTNYDVLSHFYYLTNNKPNQMKRYLMACKISNSRELLCEKDCNCVASKIIKVYKLAGIPTVRGDKVLNKIQKLVKRHAGLEKLRKRDSEKEKQKRENFTKSLSELFDIIPINVFSIIEKNKLRRPAERAEVIRNIKVYL